MAFCRNCGKEINDGAKFCAGCGTPTRVAAGAPAANNVAENAPDSAVSDVAAGDESSAPTVNGVVVFRKMYKKMVALGLEANWINGLRSNPDLLYEILKNSLVKTIISTVLFPPFGIAAIIQAIRVKPALMVEEIKTAREASQKANSWSNLAIISGIILWLLIVVVVVVPRFSDDDDEQQNVAATTQQNDEDEEQQYAAAPTQQNTASGTFTDSRDGKKYKIIKVGTQTWMAENLNYAAKGSVCYENNATNCDKYGRLYDWAAMGVSGCLSDYPNGVQGVCPAGWHLSSEEEWDQLTDFVGGSSTAGKKLKSKSGWNKDGNGTDEYGFSALPGGDYLDGSFRNVGNSGEWWLGGEDGGCYLWSWNMSYDYGSGGTLSKYGDGDDIKFSVRCVQDN